MAQKHFVPRVYRTQARYKIDLSVGLSLTRSELFTESYFGGVVLFLVSGRMDSLG